MNLNKLFILFLILCFVQINTYASSKALFSYDKEQITNEFAPLNELEAFVDQNDGISFSAILEKEENILVHLDLVDMDVSSALVPEFRIEDMDWGSFAWGFCCCPIGFFTVAISNSKSSNQKLSFWIGVGVNTILSIISNTIYYLTAPRFII